MSYGYNPITKRFVKERQRLVLTYPRSTEGFNAIPLLIERSSRLSVDYRNVGEITDGDSVELSIIGKEALSAQDPNYGPRIFDIGDEPYLLYHMGMGVVDENLDPIEGMKVYHGHGHDRILQGVETDTKVKPGEDGPIGDMGFEWSHHTIHDAGDDAELIPTDAIEMYQFMDNAQYIGFTNESGVNQTPRLIFYGRAYYVTPIAPIDMDRAKKVVKGQIPSEPRSFTEMDRDVKVQVPDEWKPLVQMDSEDLVLKGND